jgi:adenosylcobyric acid synthase
VLNKFRGERDLLAPARETLEALTGVRTVGVMPWLEHGLPDEDGVSVSAAKPGAVTVAVVRYPTASNLDEFRLLEQVADVRWVQGPEALAGAQIAVLPGSKHVAGDLAWLCRTGLDAALRRWAAEGRPLLGICGGMQMLGASIVDEGGVDGSAEGLGLLPIDSVFARGKRTERTLARFRALRPPWDALAGQTLAGYQIRHGRSAARGEVEEALADGLGLARGAVLGIYLHGLFEQPGVLQALFGAVPRRSLELAFDELADAVEEHIDVDQLLGSVVAR